MFSGGSTGSIGKEQVNDIGSSFHKIMMLSEPTSFVYLKQRLQVKHSTEY